MKLDPRIEARRDYMISELTRLRELGLTDEYEKARDELTEFDSRTYGPRLALSRADIGNYVWVWLEAGKYFESSQECADAAGIPRAHVWRRAYLDSSKCKGPHIRKVFYGEPYIDLERVIYGRIKAKNNKKEGEKNGRKRS